MRVFLKKGEKIIRQQKASCSAIDAQDSDEYLGLLCHEHSDYVEPWKVLNAVWNVGTSGIEYLYLGWDNENHGSLVFEGGTAYPRATTNLNVPWLQFISNGKKLLIPLRPLINSISWYQINARGAVYGKDINIDGVNYKCRLMKGTNTDPSVDSSFACDQSEWDRLIHRVHAHSAVDGCDKWASFTDDELGLNGPGHRNWCQELYHVLGYVCRGGDGMHALGLGISALSNYHTFSAYNNLGYRPVLELLS